MVEINYSFEAMPSDRRCKPVVGKGTGLDGPDWRQHSKTNKKKLRKEAELE
jgi:hypothetical protein